MNRLLASRYVHMHPQPDMGRNVMKNQIAVLAASVPLLLSAAGAFGGEPQYQTPTTDRAQQMQPLLSRAAHAVQDKMSEHVSDLWVFPTADDHTVFAQYTVTAKETSSEAPTSRVHLELLKIEGDRVVEERDLTRVRDDRALNAQRANGGRDWSASIGTGHATSTETPVVSTGSPASAHWSALIGSGRVSDQSTQPRQAAGNADSQVAQAHWTSKIGTARAAERS
jgi:hypothetical protein